MVDYKKEIEKMIQNLKAENPQRDVEYKEDYILDINGTKIDVSILDIKEPMEKDDEKTNINKMQILFKTKDGYVLIAEINEDNEIMINEEGIKKANLEDKVLLSGSDKIGLREKDEKEKAKDGQKEEGNKEKDDDEKPDLEEDIEEIAKQYNVNSNQVIHIAKDEKVTDRRFDGIADFAREYDDIYIIQGEDPYSWKTIGAKEGQKKEIERNNKQIGGKNPDIKIKRIDGEEITEVKPLSMYEIDSKTSIAIVKDSQGRPEALYCRQEGGDEKTYWGTIIPEASGKNVIQESPDTREFINHKNNSTEDLVEKAEALEYAKNLDERGVPSQEKGVQTYEIDGTREQNKELTEEEIRKDLYARKGIAEKMKGAMPGYLNYMEKQIDKEVKEILKLMSENDGIMYEEAIERIEEKNSREKGGPTPDEGPKKREF